MLHMPPDLNNVAVVARHLRPGIWSEDGVAYTSEVGEQRCEARRAAQDAIRARPDWAKTVIKKYRVAHSSPKLPSNSKQSRIIKQRVGLQSERNERICQRYAAGNSLSEIAEEFGLTKQRIEQIVSELKSR